MNNPVAVTLGANLRRIRESKNITRKQLAEAIGVSEVSIGGYENAHKLPPLDKIFAMADFLEVSIASLTGDNGHNPDFPSVGCTKGTNELQAQLRSVAHSLLLVARQLDD